MREPGAIARFVRSVILRSRGAYALECAALGVAAGALTAAAAVLSRANAASSAAIGVCAISALACAATWAVEHRRSTSEVVRRADARLGHDGALATAYECEARGAVLAIERALVERVAARLAPGLARRAAHGVSVALLAAPLLGAVAVAAALEWRAASERADAVRAERAAARRSATPDGAESSGRVEPGFELAGAADLDAATAAGAEAADPRELATSREREDSASADAAHAAESGAGPDRTTRGDSGAGSGAPGADRGASGAGGVPGLARGGAEPTMSGSTASGDTSMIPTPTDPSLAATPSGAAPLAEAGTLAGRWWPVRHDQVVSAWIASRSR